MIVRSQKLEVRGFLILLLFSVNCLLATVCHAELIDRIVAVVDERAITLSDLNETYEKTKQLQPGISRSEVLNTMVNRLLLLNEAKRLKLEAKDDDEFINEYIELKVKAFIRINENEMEAFYKEHPEEFKGAQYESVRDKIEEYLTEKEVNAMLKKQIEELRSKAYIKIIMKEQV